MFLRHNYPMRPHLRLLVGQSVGRLVLGRCYFLKVKVRVWWLKIYLLCMVFPRDSGLDSQKLS